jgi:hypothetical protein
MAKVNFYITTAVVNASAVNRLLTVGEMAGTCKLVMVPSTAWYARETSLAFG